MVHHSFIRGERQVMTWGREQREQRGQAAFLFNAPGDISPITGGLPDVSVAGKIGAAIAGERP